MCQVFTAWKQPGKKHQRHLVVKRGMFGYFRLNWNLKNIKIKSGNMQNIWISSANYLSCRFRLCKLSLFLLNSWAGVGFKLNPDSPVCAPAGAAGRGSDVRGEAARTCCGTEWAWPGCSCAGNQSQALTAGGLRTAKVRNGSELKTLLNLRPKMEKPEYVELKWLFSYYMWC